MCCRKEDLKPGALLVDRHAPLRPRLYEVTSDPARTVKLTDVASPIDQPAGVEFLTVNAVNRLELVRPAPCIADVASVEEWGAQGVGPT